MENTGSGLDKIMKRLLWAVVGLLLLSTLAFAQTTSQRNPCYGTSLTTPNCISVTTSTPLPVTGLSGGGSSVTPLAPSGALTLASGGVSQVLFTAGEVVNGCTIQNPSTATEKIHVNFTGAAAINTDGNTSIEVPVGSSIPCGVGIATSISWIAATTSHVINAVKF